jgi:hypothetical protein
VHTCRSPKGTADRLAADLDLQFTSAAAQHHRRHSKPHPNLKKVVDAVANHRDGEQGRCRKDSNTVFGSQVHNGFILSSLNWFRRLACLLSGRPDGYRLLCWSVMTRLFNFAAADGAGNASMMKIVTRSTSFQDTSYLRCNCRGCI